MATIFQSLGAYARGFKTTLGYLLRKPVTQQFRRIGYDELLASQIALARLISRQVIVRCVVRSRVWGLHHVSRTRAGTRPFRHACRGAPADRRTSLRGRRLRLGCAP